MVLGKGRKTPAETFMVGTDFKNRLGVGETITTPATTSKNLGTGGDSTATFLQGATQIDGSQVKHRIIAGADSDKHRVRFVVQTSAGNTFEASQDWLVLAD
jgi:hypothetical protein